MPLALVTCLQGEPFINEDGMVEIGQSCFCLDESTGTRENIPISIRFPQDATPAQIENAIEEAIHNSASQMIHNVTFEKSDMIYPDMKRGA
jgi:hypothetical protein